ncbi:uncharacterized protein LTR77_008144 [Saxophila tyrrhenica]|uniref:Peptidase A1 domain-containing protein n=1 Tax=Saxophila tyrrhenica TaxID=1690608 RepID=A0AAV9P4Q9_9PEZI|nr:hypothetical protein LTR77_008144 [Saxophila tyrrhenica]
MLNLLGFLAFLALQLCASAAQRVVVADIWKPAPTPTSSNSTLQRRELSVPLTQASDRTLYRIDITAGTPPQQQSLQLDTGSRRVWLPAIGSSICSSSLVDCADLGSFDSSESSTFTSSGQTDTIAYSDGSGVTGQVFTDTFRIGGQAVSNQVSLLGKQGTDVHEGVLGIGFPASAPTINHNLAAQGTISSNRYSIHLNSLSSTTGGTIIFGGIDLSKFVAPLLRVPVLGSDLPTVALTRVSTLKGRVPTVQTGAGYSEPAILDTGTTLTILPTALVDDIIAVMGAQYYPDATNGVTIIPCSASSRSLSINFHFGSSSAGPTINVPISQLILGGLGTLDGVDMCQFGLYASDESNGAFPTTLGETFLRSAYVLFDLDGGKIGFAQAVVDGVVGIARNVVEV